MRAEKLFMYLHKLNASMPDIPLKTIKIVVDACLSSDTALSPELVGSWYVWSEIRKGCCLVSGTPIQIGPTANGCVLTSLSLKLLVHPSTFI